MAEKISKVDAACRQLDTAIDLYFNNADALSCFTLAYAGLKVLFDIYPHHQEDGFAKQIDEMIGKENWRHLSGVGNFLKHADHDPDGTLEKFHPDSAYAVLGLAILLFRRITGEFSLKMKALDCWTEIIRAKELGIPELDENSARAAIGQQLIAELQTAPRHVLMALAKTQYDFFLANADRIQTEVEQAQEDGRSLQQILDDAYSGERDR